MMEAVETEVGKNLRCILEIGLKSLMIRKVRERNKSMMAAVFLV